MATSSWKTLKTVENLAGKPELTMGSCLILANSLFSRCDQIWPNSQESAKEYSPFNFAGCNFTQVCQKAP